MRFLTYYRDIIIALLMFMMLNQLPTINTYSLGARDIVRTVIVSHLMT